MYLWKVDSLADDFRKDKVSEYEGLKYGFGFWLLTTLWNLSHPLVYGSVNIPDQIFWILYQLVGFLGLGATLGYVSKRRVRNDLLKSISQ